MENDAPLLASSAQENLSCASSEGSFCYFLNPAVKETKSSEIERALCQTGDSWGKLVEEKCLPAVPSFEIFQALPQRGIPGEFFTREGMASLKEESEAVEADVFTGVESEVDTRPSLGLTGEQYREDMILSKLPLLSQDRVLVDVYNSENRTRASNCQTGCQSNNPRRVGDDKTDEETENSQNLSASNCSLVREDVLQESNFRLGKCECRPADEVDEILKVTDTKHLVDWSEYVKGTDGEMPVTDSLRAYANELSFDKHVECNSEHNEEIQEKNASNCLGRPSQPDENHLKTPEVVISDYGRLQPSLKRKLPRCDEDQTGEVSIILRQGELQEQTRHEGKFDAAGVSEMMTDSGANKKRGSFVGRHDNDGDQDNLVPCSPRCPKYLHSDDDSKSHGHMKSKPPRVGSAPIQSTGEESADSDECRTRRVFRREIRRSVKRKMRSTSSSRDTDSEDSSSRRRVKKGKDTWMRKQRTKQPRDSSDSSSVECKKNARRKRRKTRKKKRRKASSQSPQSDESPGRARRSSREKQHKTRRLRRRASTTASEGSTNAGRERPSKDSSCTCQRKGIDYKSKRKLQVLGRGRSDQRKPGFRTSRVCRDFESSTSHSSLGSNSSSSEHRNKKEKKQTYLRRNKIQAAKGRKHLDSPLDSSASPSIGRKKSPRVQEQSHLCAGPEESTSQKSEGRHEGTDSVEKYGTSGNRVGSRETTNSTNIDRAQQGENQNTNDTDKEHETDGSKDGERGRSSNSEDRKKEALMCGSKETRGAKGEDGKDVSKEAEKSRQEKPPRKKDERSSESGRDYPARESREHRNGSREKHDDPLRHNKGGGDSPDIVQRKTHQKRHEESNRSTSRDRDYGDGRREDRNYQSDRERGTKREYERENSRGRTRGRDNRCERARERDAERKNEETSSRGREDDYPRDKRNARCSSKDAGRGEERERERAERGGRKSSSRNRDDPHGSPRKNGSADRDISEDRSNVRRSTKETDRERMTDNKKKCESREKEKQSTRLKDKKEETENARNNGGNIDKGGEGRKQEQRKRKDEDNGRGSEGGRRDFGRKDVEGETENTNGENDNRTDVPNEGDSEKKRGKSRGKDSDKRSRLSEKSTNQTDRTEVGDRRRSRTRSVSKGRERSDAKKGASFQDDPNRRTRKQAWSRWRVMRRIISQELMTRRSKTMVVPPTYRAERRDQTSPDARKPPVAPRKKRDDDYESSSAVNVKRRR